MLEGLLSLAAMMVCSCTDVDANWLYQFSIGHRIRCAVSVIGRVFIWSKRTGELVMILHNADNSVVNCVQPHPSAPVSESSIYLKIRIVDVDVVDVVDIVDVDVKHHCT